MNFNDKLVFLMNITQISNKELAENISVDPSLISLLRSGKRRRPTNTAHIKNMANCFARRCTAQFQRDALSEMLGQQDIFESTPPHIIALKIEDWLSSDTGTFRSILGNINPVVTPPNALPSSQNSYFKTPGTVFKIGIDGRNWTIHEFFKNLLASDKPEDIYIISDGELKWFLYDLSNSHRIQSAVYELAQRGFKFHQIMPSAANMASYASTLQFWLPIYSTGQVKVYYYPRMCDNMYRRAIIVSSFGLRVSASVGTSGINDISFFSTDSDLVKAYTAQFFETKEMCRSVLAVHNNPRALPEALDAFHRMPGEHIQMVTHLPANTIPAELLNKLKEEYDGTLFFELFSQICESSDILKDQLKEAPFIDIAPLLSAEEVRSEKALIGSPLAITPDHPTYTAETYVMHLKYILHLMDTYENYHFIPYTNKTDKPYNLFSCDGGLALIVNTSTSMLMEMRQPEMIIACREFMLEVAARYGYNQGIQKNRIRLRIQNLINELQS